MKTKIALALIAITALAGLMTCQLEEQPPETVTVTFDSNGGSNISPVSLTVGQTLGAKYPTPTRGDDYFAGWYEGVTEYTADMVINVDLTLTASWITDDGTTDQLAIVTFDSDAGIPDFEYVKVVKGKAIGPRFPVNPIKQGFGFTEWQDGDGDAFTSATVVTDNMTVTAQWAAKTTFTVNFAFNTSINRAGTNDPIDPMTVYGGDCIDEWEQRFPPPPNVAADPSDIQYFRFWRWESSTVQPFIFDGRTPITANVTLTAQYQKKIYPKSFDIPLSAAVIGTYVTGSTNNSLGAIPGGAPSGTNLSTNPGGPATRPMTQYYRAASGTPGEPGYQRAYWEITFGNSSTTNEPDTFPQFAWLQTPSGTGAADFRNYLNLSEYVRIEIEGEATPDDRGYNCYFGNMHAGSNWNSTASPGDIIFKANGLDDPWSPYNPNPPVPDPYDPKTDKTLYAPYDRSNVPDVVQLSNCIVKTESTNPGNSNSGNNIANNRRYFIIRARNGQGQADHTGANPVTMKIYKITVHCLE